MSDDILSTLIVVALQFLSGSVMYAPLLAKLAKVDLRKVRDGNPGSSNLWRAAGWKYGILALALDYFKGTFPIFAFWATGYVKSPFVVSVAALAGIAGHAFSPFLRFRGGKAVAVTFGAWSVLTKWEAPTLMGMVFTIVTFHRARRKKRSTPEDDALMLLYGVLALSGYALFKILTGALELLPLYVGNVLILLFKHRREFVKKLKGLMRRVEA